MKLTFIGSGSAFLTKVHNYHSNMILEADDGEKFLIDCGSDARHALADLDYDYSDISAVYISHLHADHAGGLEWLALSRKFDPKVNELCQLFVSEHLVKSLWDKTLSGGLNTLQGCKPTLDTYFNVNEIIDNGGFEWKDIHFQLVQTVHVLSGYSLMPSFGLIFQINDTKVFITTDTQFTPQQLRDLYLEADIIFHDCETTEYASGVHANYNDLIKLEPEIKSKMWLYHFNTVDLPDAEKDGFCGFVKRGQIFEF